MAPWTPHTSRCSNDLHPIIAPCGGSSMWVVVVREVLVNKPLVWEGMRNSGVVSGGGGRGCSLPCAVVAQPCYCANIIDYLHIIVLLYYSLFAKMIHSRRKVCFTGKTKGKDNRNFQLHPLRKNEIRRRKLQKNYFFGPRPPASALNTHVLHGAALGVVALLASFSDTVCNHWYKWYASFPVSPGEI